MKTDEIFMTKEDIVKADYKRFKKVKKAKNMSKKETISYLYRTLLDLRNSNESNEANLKSSEAVNEFLMYWITERQ